MHFHMPKPIHGWRGFIGEVGIIVVGVLIALGAEQIVEHVRDQERAREASDNVRSEIAAAIGSINSRAKTEPCIARRLFELQSYVDEVGSGSRPPRPTWVGRPQVWTVGTARWQAATNTGGSSLLRSDEQAELSSIYESLNEIVVNERDEQQAWAQLRAVTHLTKIDPPEAAMLIQALQTARLTDWRIALAIAQVSQTAEKLGVKPLRNPYVGSTSVCLPMSTSYSDGVQQSGMSDAGEPQ